jgi:hypothetical protein
VLQMCGFCLIVCSSNVSRGVRAGALLLMDILDIWLQLQGSIVWRYPTSPIATYWQSLVSMVVQDKVVPTLLANYTVWPLAHALNFYYVPTAQRILYNNFVAVCLTRACLQHACKYVHSVKFALGPELRCYCCVANIFVSHAIQLFGQDLCGGAAPPAKGTPG